MKKLYRKKLILVLSLGFISVILIVMLQTSFKTKPSVLESYDNTDSFFTDTILTQTGIPEAVFDELTESQKEYILEHLEKDSEYAGFASRGYTMDSATGNLIPMNLTDSEPDLTLSVIVFKESISEREETNEYCYNVMPSFVWNRAVKVKNDSLACAVYSGWETTGEQNLRLYLKNAEGQQVQHVDISGIYPSCFGYGFRIPGDTGFVSGFYEGCAYFHMEKKEADTSVEIVMQYVHDTSLRCSAFYGVDIGEETISITEFSDNDIKMLSDIFKMEMNTEQK